MSTPPDENANLVRTLTNALRVAHDEIARLKAQIAAHTTELELVKGRGSTSRIDEASQTRRGAGSTLQQQIARSGDRERHLPAEVATQPAFDKEMQALREERDTAVKDRHMLLQTLAAHEREISDLRQVIEGRESYVRAEPLPGQEKIPLSNTISELLASNSNPTQSGSPEAFETNSATNATTYQSCTRCSLTQTPKWRKHPQTGDPLCNACGLYVTRITNFKYDLGPNSDQDDIVEGASGSEFDGDDDGSSYGPGAVVLSCAQCLETKTAFWHWPPGGGKPLCGTCAPRKTSSSAKRKVDEDESNVARAKKTKSRGVDDDAEWQGSTSFKSTASSSPSRTGGCAHCGTTKTPHWRRSLAGLQVCNACGLQDRKRVA
ncbi:Zinc finger gata-type protein [Mycena indigotica]|uniref:Zinc finger gata-type protein n=1 Tax=Mycena indigotica TaxID=2126181 RepID=A0A8H6RY25_9AGAR|nr:Zinc finger gata-type protein [Mycena indigotica]KAF7289003.1 Zinc finger gata-type protein [Mycena indigotica]